MRVQWARDREPGEANSEQPRGDRPPGRHDRAHASAATTSAPARRRSSAWQVADTLTWVRGAHKLKGGFDFQFDDILNFFPGQLLGRLHLPDAWPASRRRAERRRRDRTCRRSPATGPPGATTHPDIKEYSFFVQDEWRVATRRDASTPGCATTCQKFAKPPVRNPDAAARRRRHRHQHPQHRHQQLGAARRRRLGAGRPRATSSARGYGLFYGRTPSIMVGTAHSNNGINVQTITFTGASASGADLSEHLRVDPRGRRRCRGRPSSTSTRTTRTRASQQASAGRRMGADAGHVGRGQLPASCTGDQLPRSTDINIGASSAGRRSRSPRRRHGCRTTGSRPVRSRTSRASSRSRARAESRYNGLTVELNRRFAQGVSGPRRLHARQGRGHGARRDGRRARGDPTIASSRRTRATSTPTARPGNNDQRHRFVGSAMYTTDAFADAIGGASRACSRTGR